MADGDMPVFYYFTSTGKYAASARETGVSVTRADMEKLNGIIGSENAILQY